MAFIIAYNYFLLHVRPKCLYTPTLKSHYRCNAIFEDKLRQTYSIDSCWFGCKLSGKVCVCIYNAKKCHTFYDITYASDRRNHQLGTVTYSLFKLFI